MHFKPVTIEEIPRNEEGFLKSPYEWDFPFVFRFKTLFPEIKKQIPSTKRESKEHWLLKIASAIFLKQGYGVGTEEISCENQSVSNSFRTDVECCVHHINDLKIAVEVGNLDYPKKIKDLLFLEDYDMVYWLPFYPNLQEHYLVDYNCVMDYLVGAVPLILAKKKNNKEYWATYKTFLGKKHQPQILKWLCFTREGKNKLTNPKEAKK